MSHPVVTELERHLGHLSAPDLAVLVDGKPRPAVEAVTAWRPDARIVRLDLREHEPRLHVRLAAHGPYDAVVDLVPHDGDQRARRLLHHVRPGGVWLRRTGEGIEVETATEDAVAVVRDAEMAEVLAIDPSRGRVLGTVPGESWTVRGTLRTSRPMPANPTPDHFDAPELFLREYPDVICLPRQVAIGRNLVLPESFTTVEDHRQRNAALDKLGVDFARRPAAEGDPVGLDGRWFHLDNHLLWHFGHALSEQVSHLSYQLPSIPAGAQVL